MKTATPAKKEWTKPELVRLGTIGDVAGSKSVRDDGPQVNVKS